MEKYRSREESNPELVVFDVDGTLLPDNPDEISGRAFWELNEQGIFTSSDEKLQELSDLRDTYASCPNFERQQYLTPMIIEFDEQMKGRPRKAIQKVAEECAEHDVETLLYPELREEIEMWKERGARLGIISGSPDTFIQPIKRRLGFDLATGTRHFKDRAVYHSKKGVSTRGKEKEKIAKRWRNNIGKEVGAKAVIAAAYGDTMNDFSLLLDSYEPVAVNPKPDLELEVIKRGYRTIYTAGHLALHGKTNHSHQHERIVTGLR